MSEQDGSPYDSTAHKWLALIERRQQNFIELWHSGRWQHYYTHAQFLGEMRKVIDLRWARLAGVPPSEQINIRGSSQQGGRKRVLLSGKSALPEPTPSQPPTRAGQYRTAAVLLGAVPARL